MPGERREIKVWGGPLRIEFGGVYTVSRWACWSSLTATGLCNTKEGGVERMEKNSQGCLDRNIMLGEQAREERRGRRGAGIWGIGRAKRMVWTALCSMGGRMGPLRPVAPLTAMPRN